MLTFLYIFIFNLTGKKYKNQKKNENLDVPKQDL